MGVGGCGSLHTVIKVSNAHLLQSNHAGPADCGAFCKANRCLVWAADALWGGGGVEGLPSRQGLVNHLGGCQHLPRLYLYGKKWQMGTLLSV